MLIIERKGKSTIYYAPVHFSPHGRDIIFADVETTGLNPEFNEILEFGGVRIQDGKVHSTFNQLVKPCQPIPEHITKVNGITNEMVQDAPGIRQALTMFLDFVGNRLVIGHNWIAFDEKWIRANTQFWFGKSFWNRRADTKIMAQYIFQKKDDKHPHPKSAENPDGYDILDHKQVTLAKHFGIDTGQAHRATDDSMTCFKVFVELEKLITPQFATEIHQYYNKPEEQEQIAF